MDNKLTIIAVVLILCITWLLTPLLWSEKTLLEVRKAQYIHNLEASLRFTSIEANQHTILTELHIYKKIKNFNRKFTGGLK